MGGASPTVPKSMLPTFKPSSNCGPSGKFGPLDFNVQRRQPFLQTAASFQQHQRAVFLVSNAEDAIRILGAKRHGAPPPLGSK
jgi:hypothetical protein